ncbi:hypothetical protein HO133_005397 [Letharia lupina]|uniref:Uncharacterized protein n=1 Tax=Letharia lupina TaxID=560253 RepID=A0A8H6F8T5_9LECA|nr:uncharacterized protein HO133_005397 [Letharia lupina]KAF6218854.1 hypothetical protein HO133_005397 [Letharia lupina]
MASKSPVPLDSDGFPVVTSPITGNRRGYTEIVHPWCGGTTLREVLLQGGSALEDARKLAKETQLVKKILEARRRSEIRAATETSEQRQERLRRHALVQNPLADEQRGEDSAKQSEYYRNKPRVKPVTEKQRPRKRETASDRKRRETASSTKERKRKQNEYMRKRYAANPKTDEEYYRKRLAAKPRTKEQRREDSARAKKKRAAKMLLLHDSMVPAFRRHHDTNAMSPSIGS